MRLNCWKIMAQRRRQSRSARPLSAVISPPSQSDPAGARLGQAVDQAQQRRLAGAGTPDHANELPRGISEADDRAPGPAKSLGTGLRQPASLPPRSAMVSSMAEALTRAGEASMNARWSAVGTRSFGLR